MIGPIFQAAGGLAQGGISIYEQNQQKEKLAADEKNKLSAALAADSTAAAALARADLSAQAKSPSAQADAGVAEVAARAQERAGAALSPEANAQRIEAAEKRLQEVAQALRAAPKDPYKMALVRAWTTTVNKANHYQIVSADQPRGAPAGPSWFTRPVVGPVPGWGVLAGGAGVVTALGLMLRRFL